MYNLTVASTGGTIEFETIGEIEKFLEGAVYGIVMEASINGFEMPVDAVAGVILENFTMPGVNINIKKVAEVVKSIV